MRFYIKHEELPKYKPKRNNKKKSDDIKYELSQTERKYSVPVSVEKC